MTTLLQDAPAAPARPPAATPAEIAATLVPEIARAAAGHDAEDSFVAENYALLSEAGLLEAGVPRELGGGGADLPALCAMLTTLAHGCSSTALAFAMHTHQVAIPAWRWHNTPARPLVEPLLTRIAAERLVLLSSGGSDWIGGSGSATRVEGGWRVTARKAFTSGAPIGDLLITGALADEGDGPVVLHFPVPMSAPEVHVLDTWRALGMRGTGSQDVAIEGLFVPDAKVALKRPAGVWHPLFQITAVIAMPLVYAVYLGVAERARDLSLDLARRKSPTDRTARLAGEMDTALHAARLAHRGMIATAAAAAAPAPTMQQVSETMIGRRLVEREAIRTLELALDLAGGAGFYREAGLERLFRDIQGARHHPMPKEAQFGLAGALALGMPVERLY